jgi:hypothetical protein
MIWIVEGIFIFVCSYQLEALNKAIRENTIVYLEIGSGKTLIAIMLLRSYAYHLWKSSPYIVVFWLEFYWFLKYKYLIIANFILFPMLSESNLAHKQHSIDDNRVSVIWRSDILHFSRCKRKKNRLDRIGPFQPVFHSKVSFS